jgi:hypothetical protein
VDEDLTRIRGGGEKRAEFGMGPREAPNGTVVSFERFSVPVGVAFDVEDGDGFVGGAGCEAAAVVVEDGVVLLGGVSELGWLREVGEGGSLLSCHRGRRGR